MIEVRSLSITEPFQLTALCIDCARPTLDRLLHTFSDASWKLTSCQGPEGKVLLDAIETELQASEVYDKVDFAS